MGVSSGRSRLGDLSLQVYNRALHPDWFLSRQHHRIVQTGWEADIRIIEGGHAIIWRGRSQCVSEILCSKDHPLPEPGLLLHAPVRHERALAIRPGAGWEYQCCVESERVDREVFAHLSEELALDARASTLLQRYGRTNRLAPAPLSQLRIEARVRGLSLHAVHTIPDECALVRVQTLIELTD